MPDIFPLTRKGCLLNPGCDNCGLFRTCPTQQSEIDALQKLAEYLLALSYRNQYTAHPDISSMTQSLDEYRPRVIEQAKVCLGL